MSEVSIKYNRRSDQNKRISQAIIYPDGRSRILTLKACEWPWVERAEKHGYPFNGILHEAIGMAYEFPSEHGYDYDVLEQTHRMLRVIQGLIHEESSPAQNQR